MPRIKIKTKLSEALNKLSKSFIIKILDYFQPMWGLVLWDESRIGRSDRKTVRSGINTFQMNMEYKKLILKSYILLHSFYEETFYPSIFFKY